MNKKFIKCDICGNQITLKNGESVKVEYISDGENLTSAKYICPKCQPTEQKLMKEIIKKIIQAYSDITGLEENPEKLINKIKNEKFENIDNLHDWRNYIPEGIQNIWQKLNTETKLIAYLMAENESTKDWSRHWE